MKKRVWLLGLVILFAIALVGATVWYNLGFKQRAVVTPVAVVKVFLNEAQTQELTQGATMDWGEGVHSGSQTMPLWINNTGSVSAILQFNYNQEQLNSMGWTESWDYDNSPLAPGNTINVNITLTLPSNIGAGEYWWDSGISATQAP